MSKTGIADWLRSKLSSSEGFKDEDGEKDPIDAEASVIKDKAKDFKGQRRKYEIQDPNKMLSVMQNMTVLLRDRDEEMKSLRIENRELNKENRDMLKELAALKASQGFQRSGTAEASTLANSPIGKLLKALKVKPMTYDEIRDLLALQSKSGAYSYVSMAISQGHPIDKIREGRSRRVIRTDVEYGVHDEK